MPSGIYERPAKKKYHKCVCTPDCTTMIPPHKKYAPGHYRKACKNKFSRPDWQIQCIKYWRDKLNISELAINDWEHAFDVCWACGRNTRRVQRCHIIPKSISKKEAAAKYVIPMCPQCHDESPDVRDSSYLFVWIKKRLKKYPFPGNNFYIFRAISNSEMNTEMQMILDNDLEKPLMKNIKRYMRNTSRHITQTGQFVTVKESTLIWIITKAIKKTIKERSRA